ncbi:TIGR02217 family protein [Sphingomonas sp.]|uniref:phage distal tail protein, Rcc01695 family n=1 Tax=Sphingomonas sp. TaxID=28214 RepID=UPI001EC73A20|nr:TIGR02217 family protein [Sphingomonas sp.]MBX3593715.1 TIGR02217 family protein [Sphingomonas sp.]
MKWFGRKSGRDASRPVLARGQSAPGSWGDWPQTYEAQIRAGYTANPVAQRAVRIVAEAVASAPLNASDPALAALVNARTQGQELIQVVAAQLLLHGNAYIQLLGDGAGGVAELFALRPERVSVETDAGGCAPVELCAGDGGGLRRHHRFRERDGRVPVAGRGRSGVGRRCRSDVREPGAAGLYPAFDVLQLEDYEWAAAGNAVATARGVAQAQERLGYPAGRQHYFAGFVRDPEDAHQWRGIAAAADAARSRGVAATFIWALPQVIRDGFVAFDQEEEMQAFDDVLFPIALGQEAEVAPEVSTAILTSAGGHEARSAAWAEARTRYDVGPGVRGEADIRALLAFYRARMGPARAFRLRDPFDACSNADGAPTPIDQLIGTGDDATQMFALVKHYGEVRRRITRPVAGTVRVAIDGVETTAFALGERGMVMLDEAPEAESLVTAGFRFDVVVRFAEDSLSVNRATFMAGAAMHVPLVEVREA